jgi:hypothetical protein
LPSFKGGLAVRWNAARDQEVRAVLDDLLSRELDIPEEAVPTVHLLAMARTAPLLHLRTKKGQTMAVANLGSGALVRLGVTKYPGEHPATVRYAVTDGSDIRLEVGMERDERLKGTVVLPNQAASNAMREPAVATT